MPSLKTTPAHAPTWDDVGLEPIPGVPPPAWWPRGFTTDLVTAFPDRPVLWAPDWWPPWRWFAFRRIDLRREGWAHDLRYFLGYFVPLGMPWEQLAGLKPLPNEERSKVRRRVIDQHLYVDFLEAGFTRPTAKQGRWIVRTFGASHYWWATPEALEERGIA